MKKLVQNLQLLNLQNLMKLTKPQLIQDGEIVTNQLQKTIFQKSVLALIGIFYFCIFLIYGSQYLFNRMAFTSTSSEFIKWVTIIVCVNQFWSYACVSLINPGVINYDKNNFLDNRPRCSQQLNIEKDNKTWYYSVCKLFQLHGTVHCRDCDVCIQEMDHHFPWTGKCIGKGNIKQFYYFLVSSLIFMIFNIIGSLTQLDGSLNETRRKVKQGN